MKVINENYAMKWFEFVDEKLIHHEAVNEYSIAFDNNGKIKNIVNTLGSLVNENSEVFIYFKNKYDGQS